MRRWDLPDRYDLEMGDGEDGHMEKHPQGDYVEFDTYQELYDAFEKLQSVMGDIAMLSENAGKESQK